MLRVEIVDLPGGEVIDAICIVNLSGLAEDSSYAVWQETVKRSSADIVHVRHNRSEGWLPLVTKALMLLNSREVCNESQG